ncbi:ABC transporter permease [Amedibacterium intestinale]|uniref:ABC transporter permease n=1 Tax=Amedibacterium intestinale TaxID=2583452 RepID=A0A6N4TJB9_9FIRM|nr:ABC transporter permease [Amedibacterium intestinale]BBK23110.1 ABC transporter permease [Amedibacterium intestinale]
MKKREVWMPIAVAIALIGMWEFCVDVFHVPLYLLPSPSRILISLYENRSVLFSHAMVTLVEALLGLGIALVLAMSTAILMDISKAFRNSVYPHLVVTQTVPVMVLAPLFSIWLGFGMAPKVLIVIFMCYFPITISFADGMAQVSQKQINLLKSFQASRFQIYTMVKIPAAASSLFSGLKVGATYCIGGAIVGEWISSSAGLGYYMLRMKNGYMLDKVFASVIVVIILSLLLNGCVDIAKKWLCPHAKKEHKE